MKYIKSLLLMFSIFLVLNLIVTVLSYFNLLNEKGINILKSIILITSIIISGFYIGKNSSKKGYIEGLKLGLIIVSISIFLVLILSSVDFNTSTILYYLIIIVLSIIGSTFGINLKKA